MKRLEELKTELEKCVKCGTCRSVCPTMGPVGAEYGCARGRLALVDSYLKGDISLSEKFTRRMKDCTLCGACVSTCPSRVPTPEIIQAARREVFEKKGVSTVANLVLKNLESTVLMNAAMKFASRLQGVLFRAGPENGLVSRFSLPLMDSLVGSGRLIPGLAGRFFLDSPEAESLSEISKDAPEGGPRVAFYAGCGVNYLMPEVGKSTVKALQRAGAEVVVPPAQVCCGMPAYSAGDVDTARALAEKNLKVFEELDVDYIVTSCATCGHGLKSVFGELLEGDPGAKKRAGAFSAKVRDITELLAGELSFKGVGEGEDRSARVVTYHDPCHLGRYQGLREAPRDLVKKCKNLELREMPHPCRCCGLGGGLGMTNYGLSIEVARNKAESVRKSGADTVVTACPGCMVQLRDALNRYGVHARVAHVVELL